MLAFYVLNLVKGSTTIWAFLDAIDLDNAFEDVAFILISCYK